MQHSDLNFFFSSHFYAKRVPGDPWRLGHPLGLFLPRERVWKVFVLFILFLSSCPPPPPLSLTPSRYLVVALHRGWRMQPLLSCKYLWLIWSCDLFFSLPSKLKCTNTVFCKENKVGERETPWSGIVKWWLLFFKLQWMGLCWSLMFSPLLGKLFYNYNYYINKTSTIKSLLLWNFYPMEWMY